ncbi:putative glycosyl transferase [Symbiobacterium thermophilum IAM 14863]|uniref:Putative glycosyl transferase n=2 Tax=Symbiobacterium thermophilum TaxID=2734 RepID=Q67KV4_SYMTH|nr:putative glycosyl transferase [Symbiobacterium thermophilum IAM 14863]
MEVLYCDLISQIAKAEVVIACPRPWVARFKSELGAKARVIELRDYNPASGLSWGRLRAVAQAIEDIKPDIVHTNEARMRVAVQLVRRLPPFRSGTFKHIHMQHIREVWRKSYLPERILTGSGPDLWIAVSHSVREFLINCRRVKPTSILFVPNYLALVHQYSPIESHDPGLRDSLGVSHDEVLIVAAGRLERQKGFDILIQAAHQLTSRCNAFRIVIAGEGSERERLQGLIEEYGLVERVRLLGWRNDLQELYSVADVFVLSSRWEGMPLTLIEALMSGPALVATKVDGVVDVMAGNHEVCGLIVPPDDPKALSDALFTVVADSKCRHELRKRVRQRATEMRHESNALPRLLDQAYQMS